jgi:hypothetical protein
MSKEQRIKFTILVSMVAVLLLRSMQHPTLALIVLAFGAFNTLLPVPGTQVVRAIAVGAVFAGLGWPDSAGIVVFLAAILWVPAYLIAVIIEYAPDSPNAIGRVLEPLADDAPGAETLSNVKARVAVAAGILSIVVVMLVYQWLGHDLRQTSALFIGIPGMLAIVVVLIVSPGSSVGVAMKATTVALLVSMIFLHEGALCVLMAAPLFYGIAGLVGHAADTSRRARTTGTQYLSGAVLLALPLMSLEGVTERTTLNRHESVTESRIVDAPSDAVGRALFASPRFDRERPPYLRSGFPSAIATRIDRDANGTRWVIRMRGGEMLITGMEPRAGDLVLALEEARPGMLRWRAVSDSSHMTHFLDWRESIVRWETIDEHTTRVTWTVTYDRRLDPSWYFGPMERYAMRLAAGYLIESVATP